MPEQSDGSPPAPDWIAAAGWMPLRQHWRGASGPEAGFNPGCARISFGAEFLGFEVVLREINPRNRATGLNERTWRLGSVCEIFVQARADRYIELHVTPENQRLQLAWPPEGLRAMQSGEAKLETFMIADERWCRSSVAIEPEQWRVQVELPFSALEIDAGYFLQPNSELRAAVCRYDGSRADPIHSSTAPLAEAAYHRHWEWHRIIF